MRDPVDCFDRPVDLPVDWRCPDIWLLASLEKTALVMGAIWFVIGLAYLCWITRFFRQAPPEVGV